MPPLVQICVVIVTLAFVAIAITTIRALLGLGQAAAQLTSSAEVAMAQGERIAQELEELLVSMRGIMPPAQRVMSRFEQLGERAADLSSVVLDEIEQPVLNAVAVARGVKIGTTHLVGLLTRRFWQHNTSRNGDQQDE
jgi:uncharacterized protein YoxC